MNITRENVIRKSENVVFRKIEDEYLLVPLVSSVADGETIFNLNETGAIIWDKIDGKKRLMDIIKEIQTEYEVEEQQLENDVFSLLNEMVDARLIEVL
jgi:hypothetical protein